MERRWMCFVLGSVIAGLLAPTPYAAPSPDGQKAVTLAVSGMTWGGCASAVQSALKKVKGVKDVKVSLSAHEAVVKYDSAECKVDDLLKAVKDTKGMHSYRAKVKTD